MTIFQAVILGLVQGLTEFLPVSSSGHLVIFQSLLGFQEPPILFTVLVHLATLLAVSLYFWKRFLQLTSHQILLVVVGTVPAVIAGLVIEPYLERVFSSLLIVAVGLLITSALLWTAHRCSKGKTTVKEMTFKQSVIIGLFQAVAIIPGVSRSGSTVSAGLSSQLSKDDAFYFSFLLAMPAILGAGVLQAKDIDSVNQLLTMPNIVGFATAAISGVFALKMLDILIHKAKLHYFAVYCLCLSVVIFIYQFVM